MPSNLSILLVIYHDLDAFPPTLNALTMLNRYGKAQLLARPSGPPVAGLSGLLLYGKFIDRLKRLLEPQRPAVIVLHDPLALLAYSLLRPWLAYRPKIVWYHNHDVLEPRHVQGSLLNRLAVQAERRALRWLDVFSLPADERRRFYPLERFSGRYYRIPNYASRALYQDSYRPRSLEGRDEVRLIFQGMASADHGLEAIISHILPWTHAGKRFRLLLKGRISPGYRAALEALALRSGVGDRLEFRAYTDYHTVRNFTAQGHIGVAIFQRHDPMNSTLGTASNKIYEYTALGLPVLLHDNAHFREHLDRFSWAFFTDGSAEDLRGALAQILERYSPVSAAARRTFIRELNFERVFGEVSAEIFASI